MHILAVLRGLERKYSQEVVIIGVHSAKFLAEKASANLRYAIRRLRVEHPMVNDKDFQVWQAYTVRAWPTLMFIDPQGRVIGKHEGEAPFVALDRLISDLVRQYDAEGILNREPSPWQRELDEARAGSLYFPGKILADGGSGRLFIADTGHNRVIIAKLDGSIQDIIGSGEPGWQDGDFATSRFDSPQGMALHGGSLYVADTENHLIRRVDVERRTVETVAGTGAQAMGRTPGGSARKVPLSSPWDLAIIGESVYIAMAGLHQIWALDLQKETVSVFAGAGNEGLRDGPREAAWFAQPSGLTVQGDRLYVADTEASAVRWITLGPHGATGTVVGLGLFDFGDIDGVGESVRLQHATGIVSVGETLYVADTYNNKIKRVIPATREAITFAGTGRAGAQDGGPREASFNEPGGLSAARGLLYVADTNNHKIRTVDLATGDVRSLMKE